MIYIGKGGTGCVGQCYWVLWAKDIWAGCVCVNGDTSGCLGGRCLDVLRGRDRSCCGGCLIVGCLPESLARIQSGCLRGREGV